MLDFEEELKKFRPSPEIDQVEDNVYKNNLAEIGRASCRERV